MPGGSVASGVLLGGTYQLERRLGVGSASEVWRARHARSGRAFAVKIVDARMVDSTRGLERFAREVRLAARIGHPGIVDVYDTGEHEGRPYAVMELLEGASLEQMLEAGRPDTPDVVRIARDAARVVAAAHAVGVVHRDLKPANLFVCVGAGAARAEVRVLDFGISKLSRDEEFATSSGSFLGSPRYMSPEQIESAATVDGRTDVWSLGVVLFHALTGEWPHATVSFAELLVAIARRPARSLDEVAPALPADLRRLVFDCLLPRDRRLADMSEVARRLDAVHDALGGPDSGRPTPRMSERPGIWDTTLPLPEQRISGIHDVAGERLAGAHSVGRWSLGAQIAAGAVSRLFTASDATGTTVTLELLEATVARYASLRAAFVESAHVCSRVAHPGVLVPLDDGIADDGKPFLVFEPFAGETLAARAAREPRGTLPVADASRWIDAACDVLAAAHEAGVVHGSLRPGALLVTSDGAIKVLDLGRATFFEVATAFLPELLPLDGPWVAPECRATRVAGPDPRTDVWGLARCLLVLTAGVAAAEASFESALPSSMLRAVHRALDESPSCRFHSVRELQAALRDAQTSPPGQR